MKLREQILSIEYKVQENEGPVWERGFRVARADAAHLGAKQDQKLEALVSAVEALIENVECIEDWDKLVGTDDLMDACRHAIERVRT